MKKSLKIILIILLSIILVYVIYKGLLFYTYKDISDSINNTFSNYSVPQTIDDLNVKESNTKYIIYNNKSFGFNNSDYQKKDYLYCRIDNQNICIIPGYDANEYYYYNNLSLKESKEILLSTKLFITKTSDLFKKHNINNNKDLFLERLNYIKTNKNVFSSTKDLEYDILMKNMLLFLPRIDKGNIYTISGDYDGYIINEQNQNENAYYVYACQNNKDACAGLHLFEKNTKYFTKDKITEIISSIKI